MKQPKQFSIDGESYTIQPFLTTHGMMLLTEIGALVGADLFSMMGTFGDVIKDGKKMTEADIDLEQMVPALGGFISKLKPDSVDALFKKILAGTMVDSLGSSMASERAVYDSHFQGRYVHLLKVVWTSLNAQYGDFSAALGSVAAVQRAKVSIRK